jgi:hypothetical protein
MPIVLNQYCEIRQDDDGNNVLFGKAGYQTMSPKTDRYIKANLAAIERALDAGELLDINGEPCTDNAVIMLPTRVTKVKAQDAMDQVGRLTNAAGFTTVNVPEAQVAAEDESPF